MGFIICKGAIQYFDLHLILFFSCFCLKFSIATNTISITQPIIDPQSIVSNNKVFQLGFFTPINSTNHYVGIWFKSIPVKTVVWVANRDRPLTDSSGTLMISEDGNLVVLNGQKEIIWSSNVSNSAVNSSAQLLDTGNFVLKDNSNGITTWKSFQYPSDSFIQKMKLSSDATTGEKRLLKSWKSPSDPSVGSFSAGINSITIPEFFIWNDNHPYWRSGPWNGKTFIGHQGLTSTYRETLNVIDNKEGIVSQTFTYASKYILTYFVLNHDGTISKMVWMEGMEKPEVTLIGPPNDCEFYGRCGPFASCNLKDAPICSCLKGFESKHKNEWNSGNFTSGCRRRMALQYESNTSSNGTRSKKDGFLKLTTMKVPDLLEWSPVTADECENLCLKSCSCTAYSYYADIGCMLRSASLIDINKMSTNGANLYIRVAYSELDKSRNMQVVIAISVTLGSTIVVVCVYFSVMWMVKQRGMKKKRNMRVLTDGHNILNIQLKCHSYIISTKINLKNYHSSSLRRLKLQQINFVRPISLDKVVSVQCTRGNYQMGKQSP